MRMPKHMGPLLGLLSLVIPLMGAAWAIAPDQDKPMHDLGRPKSKVIPVPTIDISGQKDRHVIVAAGTEKVYQGHATTLLMPDGKTMFCTWTYGHGGGCGPIKRSNDAGLTWSELLPVPKSWRRVRNCPSIHRLVDPKGKERLIVFAGNGPMYQSISEDGGKTWTEMTKNGLGCVVAPQTVLPVEGGKKYRMWVHRGRGNRDRPPLKIWQSETIDGGLTWANERMICYVKGANPCEPAVIRSPDGKQMLMLMRENARRYNSLMMTSDDEGQTWSAPREAPPSLTGDRHRPRYLPDGRLMAVFRDTNPKSPTRSHFVGWIGRYEDIIAGRQGQYRVKLLHSHAGGDCGYGCLERLPDGTMAATTYVKYAPGRKKHSLVSVRFKIEALDAKLKERSPKPRRVRWMMSYTPWRSAVSLRVSHPARAGTWAWSTSSQSDSISSAQEPPSASRMPKRYCPGATAASQT